jgi:uncharacterized protein with HEPN domain
LACPAPGVVRGSAGMRRQPRSDRLRLADIVAATRLIAVYIADGKDKFRVSTLVQDAVIRQLEVIGEAAGHVSPPLRVAHPEVPWRGMRGFASLAKHESWRLEPERLWNAAVECSSIGTLVSEIRAD